MCEDVFAFWWARGHIEEGLDWLDRALTLDVPPEERSSVLRAASYLRVAKNEFAIGESLAREAIEIAATVDCHWVGAYALLVVGWCADVAGDPDHGLRAYQDALTLSRKNPVVLPFRENTFLQCLAEAASRAGDFDLAETYARESLAVVAPYSERYGAGFSLRTLGWILHEKGDSAGALDAWRQGFQASCEVDDPWRIADSLATFGRVALDAGGAALAARWLGAADALRERSGRQLDHYEKFEQSVTRARSCLGPERFDTAWHAGSGLSPLHVWTEFEDAALDQAKPVTVPSPASVVTPREREILDLLVAGKTDREISETLFLSVRTVEGHVSRIFTKLGVRTRTAAVTTAITSGLVTTPLIQ